MPSESNDCPINYADTLMGIVAYSSAIEEGAIFCRFPNVERVT